MQGDSALAIDRLAPTRRPLHGPCGYQQWRSLLFMHWQTPKDVLRALVPPSLDIDLFDGQAYVGLVPFAMQDVRPWWAPKIAGFSFLETNVRTYVTYRGEPGVYFFSLDAASRIGVWAARTFWGLPYHFAQMKLVSQGGAHTYESHRSGSAAVLRVTCEVGPRCAPSQPDSLEFFFLERYKLFLERGGRPYSGQVHHTPYPFHSAKVLEFEDGLLSAAGLDCCRGLPEHSHFSPGVNVEIFRMRRGRRTN